MADNEDDPTTTFDDESTSFQRLINRWSYHPERQLLEWLTNFHDGIEKLVISTKSQDASDDTNRLRRNKSKTLTFNEVDNLLKENRTIHQLANDEEFNVFCKLSEILESSHSSDEVSSDRFKKVRDLN